MPNTLGWRPGFSSTLTKRLQKRSIHAAIREHPDAVLNFGGLRELTKFDPIMCGFHHFRPSTAIVECSFWGQWRLENPGGFQECQVILSGERFLSIDNVIYKNTWVADKIFEYIKESENKSFFVHPTPYLRESLKRFNSFSIIPRVTNMDTTYFNRAKVIYTSITSLCEEGNTTSELDDLKKLIPELIDSKKIRIQKNSNFDLSKDNCVNSLLLIIKPMLELLLAEEKQIFPPVF